MEAVEASVKVIQASIKEVETCMTSLEACSLEDYVNVFHGKFRRRFHNGYCGSFHGCFHGSGKNYDMEERLWKFPRTYCKLPPKSSKLSTKTGEHSRKLSVV